MSKIIEYSGKLVEVREIQRGKAKVKQFKRTCIECEAKDWVKLTPLGIATRYCQMCATDRKRQEDITYHKETFTQDEDNNKSMIEKFLQEKKPSVTFEEEAIRHESAREEERKRILKQIATNDSMAKAYKQLKVDIPLKSKKNIEVEIKVKKPKKLKFPSSLASDKKKFKTKAEGLKHYTKKLKKIFTNLGYEKKVKTIFDSPEVFNLAVKKQMADTAIMLRSEVVKNKMLYQEWVQEEKVMIAC